MVLVELSQNEVSIVRDALKDYISQNIRDVVTLSKSIDSEHTDLYLRLNQKNNDAKMLQSKLEGVI